MSDPRQELEARRALKAAVGAGDPRAELQARRALKAFAAPPAADDGTIDEVQITAPRAGAASDKSAIETLKQQGKAMGEATAFGAVQAAAKPAPNRFSDLVPEADSETTRERSLDIIRAVSPLAGALPDDVVASLGKGVARVGEFMTAGLVDVGGQAARALLDPTREETVRSIPGGTYETPTGLGPASADSQMTHDVPTDNPIGQAYGKTGLPLPVPLKSQGWYRESVQPRVDRVMEGWDALKTPELRRQEQDTAQRMAAAEEGSVADQIGASMLAIKDNPRALGAMVLESLPLMGVSLTAAASAKTLIGARAALSAQRAGMNQQLTKALVDAAEKRAAVTTSMTVEGLQGGESSADETMKAFEQIPDAELLKMSPTARQRFERNEPMSSIRQAMAEDLSAGSFRAAAAITMLASKLSGSANFEADIVRRTLLGGTRAGQVAKQFVRGTATEALEEAPQSGGETYAENKAMIDVGVDPTRSPYRGVAGTAVQGFAAGGLMGGPMGAFHGATAPLDAATPRGDQRPPAPPDVPRGTAPDESPPGIFDDLFTDFEAGEQEDGDEAPPAADPVPATSAPDAQRYDEAKRYFQENQISTEYPAEKIAEITGLSVGEAARLRVELVAERRGAAAPPRPDPSRPVSVVPLESPDGVPAEADALLRSAEVPASTAATATAGSQNAQVDTAVGDRTGGTGAAQAPVAGGGTAVSGESAKPEPSASLSAAPLPATTAAGKLAAAWGTRVEPKQGKVAPKPVEYPAPTGYRIEYDDGELTAFDAKGKKVGDAGIGADAETGKLMPQIADIRVDSAHRRKGIATAFYDAAEQIVGKPILPGGTALAESLAVHAKRAERDGRPQDASAYRERAKEQTRSEAAGKALRSKPPVAESAQAPTPTAKARVKPGEAAKARLRPEPGADDLVTFLRKNGGLQNNVGEVRGRLKHLNVNNRTFGLAGIERSGYDRSGRLLGMTLDQAAELATEAGYIQPSATGYDQRALLDALERAEDGTMVWSDQNHSAADDAMRRRDEELTAQDKERGLDADALDEAMRQNHVPDSDRGELSLIDQAERMLGPDAIERLAMQFEDDDAGFFRALDEAIYEQEGSQSDQDGTGGALGVAEAKSRRGYTGEEGSEVNGAREPKDLFGDRPERSDVDAERLRREQRADTAKRAAPSPESFRLAGSNAEADQAAAAGQRPIFEGVGKPAEQDQPDARPLPRYATEAELTKTGKRQIGAKRVRTAQDAANAMAYLGRNGVERMDILVADKGGKPLAVVGGFKGTIDGSAVYPRTILGEVMGLPGAANLWMAHNHPSGITSHSPADRALVGKLRDTFKGTGVELRGSLVIGGSKGGRRPYEFADPFDTDARSTGSAEPMTGVTVPVMERIITADGKLGPAMNTPAAAAKAVMAIAGKTPGVIFLDGQHQPLAFVPWRPDESFPLMKDDRLARLYEAATRANAAAAIIANPDGAYTRRQVENLGGALKTGPELRVLDAFAYNSDGSTRAVSYAEQGIGTGEAGIFFQLAAPRFNYSEEAKKLGIDNYESFRRAFFVHADAETPVAVAAKRILAAAGMTPAANGLKVSKLIEAYRSSNEGAFRGEVAEIEARITASTPPPSVRHWASVNPKGERGAAVVREALTKARDQNTIRPETADMALWLLDRNPNLAADHAVAIRPGLQNVAGSYNPPNRLITLFSGSEKPDTAVHEILHHSERMMPEDVQEAIHKEWRAAVDREMKAAAKAGDTKRLAAISALQRYGPDLEARARANAAFQNGTLTPEDYALANASEYWAVNATRILSERYAADSWQARAAQWLRDFIEKVRSILKLPPDDPILRGLRAVLKASGEKVSGQQLNRRSADAQQPGGAQTETPSQKKLSASIEAGKEFVEKIEKLAEQHGTVYIRWSPSPDRDMAPNQRSRDFALGETRNGVSAVEITDSMHPVDIAKRLSEYMFLRMQDSRSVPHIYLGKEIGRNSDGYSNIRPTEHLATGGRSVIDAIDAKLSEVMDAEDEVATLRSRLERFGNAASSGKEITEKSLQSAQRKLDILSSSAATADFDPSDPNILYQPAAGPNGRQQPLNVANPRKPVTTLKLAANSASHVTWKLIGALNFKFVQDVRDFDTPSLKKIADMVMSYEQHGGRTNPQIRDFIHNRFEARGRLEKRLADILRPVMKRGKLEKGHNADLWKALTTGVAPTDPDLATAYKAMRNLQDQMLKYQRTAGLDVGEVANYFPRIYDRDLIKRNPHVFTGMLVRNGIPQNDAHGITARIIDNDGLLDHGINTSGRMTAQNWSEERVGDVQGGQVKSSHQKSRALDIPDSELAPWLEKNVAGVMSRYINLATRRAEYARTFGSDERRLNKLLKAGLNELAQQDRLNKPSAATVLKTVYGLADAMQGVYRPIDDSAMRNLNDFLVNMLVMMHLAYSAFSSISEVWTPLLTGEVDSISFAKGLSEGIKTAIVDTSMWAKEMVTGKNGGTKTDMKRAAEEMGLTSIRALQDAYDTAFHGITPKITNAFMNITLLPQLTNIQKVIAYSAFMSEQKRIARSLAGGKQSKTLLNILKDYGLDEAELRAWGGRGTPNQKLEMDMRRAAQRFTMRAMTTPHEANRPEVTQRPALRLVFLFQSFSSAFANTLLKRVMQNYARNIALVRKGEADLETWAALAKPIAGAILMVTTSIWTQILRELLKYGDDEDELPPWAMAHKDTADQMLTGIDRSGFMGPIGSRLFQFYSPYRTHAESGGEMVAAQLGPFVGDIAQGINAARSSKPEKQARYLVTRTPFLNMLPEDSAVRKKVQEQLTEVLDD